MNRSDGYRRQSHDTRQAARAHLRELREARLARRGPAQPAAGADEPERQGASAPRISVSRAASEAISEWSRRETGLRDPDEGAARADPSVQVGAEEGRAPDSPVSAPLDADGGGEGAGDAAGGGAAPADPSVADRPAAAADPERPASARPASPAAQAGSGVAAEGSPGSAAAAAEPAVDAAPTVDAAPAVDAAVEAPPDPGTPPRDTPEPAIEADPRTSSPESDLHSLPGAGIGLVWMLQRCGVSSLADLAAADPDRLRRDMGLVGELLDLSSWIDFAQSAVEDAPPAAR